MGTEQFDFQMDIQRRAIDEIDNKLVTLLIERFKHSQRIGEIKKELVKPIEIYRNDKYIYDVQPNYNYTIVDKPCDTE